MNQSATGLDGQDARRARIEELLARYPDVAEGELEVLVHWFRKEASARDVAIVASNESIRERYGRFRRDHIDRLRPRDALVALAFVVAVVAVIGGILYLAPI